MRGAWEQKSILYVLDVKWTALPEDGIGPEELIFAARILHHVGG
jgi:hypothetical protein